MCSNIMILSYVNTPFLQEVQNFAKYVVRNFFEVAQKNSKVFVELFFLKTVKDSVEITEGYGSYKAK